eukprot:COSAG05_NODE_3998_length_1727_cov_94.053669_1_plen_90_part_10
MAIKRRDRREREREREREKEKESKAAAFPPHKANAPPRTFKIVLGFEPAEEGRLEAADPGREDNEAPVRIDWSISSVVAARTVKSGIERQ